MLRTRLLTAAVLLPIVAGLIVVGGLPYLALVSVCAVAAEAEFVALLDRRGFRPIHLGGIAVLGLCLADGWFPDRGLLGPGLGVISITSFGWQVLHYRRSRSSEWASAISSGLYVGIGTWHLIRLRAIPGDGLWWTLIVILATLAADAAAYVIGSSWGRRKLAPRLSSGKTWEGYVGAILVNSTLGAGLGALWNLYAGPSSQVTWYTGSVIATIIAVLAPLGDLAISMAKREADVEDSGRLLPGHGGMLDRLDTVLFAAVIAHTYLLCFVI